MFPAAALTYTALASDYVTPYIIEQNRRRIQR